ncbi:MAG TPA: FKBP-type peptidyl-prolyl cis-trans isomerase [Acidimicrobiales bacterium]|nr:FKBP-type peptidyl-prolyl cis-trans isomerase [Acidimicrobiales bacterium]HLN41763.1 FKBP-type peptidyl-prolyl cis-trans isomerase [Acidimicrobiales bacterium]
MGRRFLVGVVVVMGVVLAACGSSTPSSTTSTAAGSPTASGPTTTGSSTALPATTAGPTPSGLAAANPPAVAGATDVKVEPVIGSGSAPPPTSLETKDLVVGTGPAAVASSTVDVFYVGANYTNGKVFDDTPWREHQATPFPLSGVVPGFGQGIVGMKVGGRREIVIPPALGYGATGDSPAVSPNETLVFVVDLTSVK